MLSSLVSRPSSAIFGTRFLWIVVRCAAGGFTTDFMRIFNCARFPDDDDFDGVGTRDFLGVRSPRRSVRFFAAVSIVRVGTAARVLNCWRDGQKACFFFRKRFFYVFFFYLPLLIFFRVPWAFGQRRDRM